MVNEFFNQGRSQVVQLAYTQDNWRAMGAVSDGVNSANTAAITTGSGTDAFAFTARGEYIVSGTWDNFSDYTSPRGSETSVVIGGAGHWQRDKYNAAGANDEFYTWTFDAIAKFNGASLSGYVVGRHNNPGGGVSVDEFGFVVQGSFYFTDEWEGFGRYEFGDDDINTDLSILTVCANYYLDGHNAKWTTDVGLATNSVAGAWSGAAATGWRTDSATDDGQVVFRTQLQLLF